jgi:FAD:protein FMN transferase
MPQNDLLGDKLFKKAAKLMGNAFEIAVVSETREIADRYIEDAINEIRRIEELLSTFRETSETNLINRNAGIAPVTVSNESYQLIERSIRISELTQGAFDITYGSIDKDLWNFNTSMTRLPDKETAEQAVRLINYRNIELDHNSSSVFLKNKGMRIGFGAIGKGYAADMARMLLKRKGVKAGFINASGDISTWGTLPDGKPFTIGIADPRHRDRPFSFIELSDKAIATSGTYEKFAVIEGKKYAHTIDPKTGYPVTGIDSVTIIAPTAELADALATPVMVMGTKAGLALIQQIKHIGCIIVDEKDRVYTTSNIKIR